VETSISPTTIAWFRPARPDPDDPADEFAALAAALAPGHAIEPFDRARAHDYVWMRARRLVDTCVYELADTPAHAFIWPYLLRFPGVLFLRDASLEASRAGTLVREDRVSDYAAEFAFDRGEAPRLGCGNTPALGGWPLLRAPIAASRLVVVREAALAAELTARYPGAEVRCVPIGVSAEGMAPPPGAPGLLRVGLVADRDGVALRALRDGAGRAGVVIEAGGPADAARLVASSDAVAVLDWPPRPEPAAAALLALAAGRPLVVLETTATAGWPALDPQNWRPRGRQPGAAPIAVSLDPRDEAHSLGLALRRLCDDAGVRDGLAEAGRVWWAAHATPAHAAEAWAGVIDEGTRRAEPVLPAGWPAHLRPDPAAAVRSITQRFGVEFTGRPRRSRCET
jgi:hypothetical protein